MKKIISKLHFKDKIDNENFTIKTDFITSKHLKYIHV